MTSTMCLLHVLDSTGKGALGVAELGGGTSGWLGGGGERGEYGGGGEGSEEEGSGEGGRGQSTCSQHYVLRG